MPDPKPRKPWRVTGGDGSSTDYRGEAAAWKAAFDLTRAGHKASIWRFEFGWWQPWERLTPEDIPQSGEGSGSGA